MRKTRLFVDFVQCDQKICAISKEIEQLSLSILQLYEEIASLENSMVILQEKVGKIRKDIHFAELELTLLDTQVKNNLSRSLQTSNSKEYSSLIKELAQIKEKKESLEESIFLLWASFEAVSLEYTNMQNSSLIRIFAINETIEHKKKEQESLAEVAKKLEEERDAKARLVGDTYIAEYKHMQEKVSNPVVPIENNSCSACFSTVPRHDLIQAQQGALVRCNDCYRFLFLYNSAG